METFNLLDESWIPVLYLDGTFQRVGIRQAFADAHRIRDIAASNPMDRFAVLRFLLSVLYWCKGNPTEADREVTRFPAEWFAKLEKHSECFNLLGEGKRFYQSAEAQNETPESILPLISETPTGDDKWHFRHSTDNQSGYCLPCCALGLLRLPLFTIGEGRGHFQGINGKPPVYWTNWGESFAVRLMSCWTDRGELGTPSWLDQETGFADGLQFPLLSGLTFLPRVIWLAPPGTIIESCINCGSRGNLISQCHIRSRDILRSLRQLPEIAALAPSKRTKELNERRNQLWSDPMALRHAPNEGNIEAPDLREVKEFDMDRPWTVQIGALLNQAEGHEGVISIIAFATKQASNVDVWERRVDIRQCDSSALYATSINDWNIAGNKLADRIRQDERKKRKETPVELKSSIIVFRPHVEHIVSQRAVRLMQGGEEGWNEAANEWREPLRAAARSLAPDYTAECLVRRAQIRNAIPRWKDPTQVAVEKPKKAGKRK